VVIRLSSAPGDIHSDTIPAPRGMAIKVIGVEGERLLPDDQGAIRISCWSTSRPELRHDR
jgi:hypothetical protein